MSSSLAEAFDHAALHETRTTAGAHGGENAAATGWFSLRHWPVRNRDQAVIGLLTFYVDTTPQVLLEQRTAYQHALAQLDAASTGPDITAAACRLLAHHLGGAQVRFLARAGRLGHAAPSSVASQQRTQARRPSGSNRDATLQVSAAPAEQRGPLLQIDWLAPGVHASYALALGQDTVDRLGPVLARERAIVRGARKSAL